MIRKFENSFILNKIKYESNHFPIILTTMFSPKTKYTKNQRFQESGVMQAGALVQARKKVTAHPFILDIKLKLKSAPERPMIHFNVCVIEYFTTSAPPAAIYRSPEQLHMHAHALAPVLCLVCRVLFLLRFPSWQLVSIFNFNLFVIGELIVCVFFWVYYLNWVWSYLLMKWKEGIFPILLYSTSKLQRSPRVDQYFK